MKNKKMILAIVVIAVVGLGSIFVPKFFNQQKKVKSADVKVGVLQFVTHPALDEIYGGIKEGLAEVMRMLKSIFTMHKLTNQK